jgi:hypothetical protein
MSCLDSCFFPKDQLIEPVEILELDPDETASSPDQCCKQWKISTGEELSRQSPQSPGTCRVMSVTIKVS